jgi:hypothetical protein
MMPRDDAPTPVTRRRDHPVISALLGILFIVAVVLTVGMHS